MYFRAMRGLLQCSSKSGLLRTQISYMLTLSIAGKSSPCRAALTLPQDTEASKMKDSVAVARKFARQDICVRRQRVCGTVTAVASGKNFKGTQQYVPRELYWGTTISAIFPVPS